MSTDPASLLGGNSVYCINAAQMREATRMLESDSRTAPLLASALRDLESRFDRNERAALAFLLIERLRDSAPSF